MLRCPVVGEGSQSRKATCYVIPFIWHCKRDKTARTENRSVVSRSWGWGEGMTTKDMKEFGRWRKRCASWLWWWLQDYWCMSRVLELYTKRVSSTECKLYLDKPNSSKKKRIHSCKILENCTFMVSRQYVVTLLMIALVGSPFVPSSKGQKAELVTILLQGGNLDSARVPSSLWQLLKILHLRGSPRSFTFEWLQVFCSGLKTLAGWQTWGPSLRA